MDACPVDCIHPKKDEPAFADSEMLYIDPVEYLDCGACVPVCPDSAIFALEDLPDKWAHFRPRNAVYYAERNTLTGLVLAFRDRRHRLGQECRGMIAWAGNLEPTEFRGGPARGTRWPVAEDADGVKLSDLFSWFDGTHFFEEETQKRLTDRRIL